MSQASGPARPIVVIYVFSGPHLGARIELPTGSWLLGSDDSCDIILDGLEARHAVLDVSEADQQSSVGVSVKPLDGQVRLADGAAAGDDGAVTQVRPEVGSGWLLGQTCLAWNRPEAIQPILEADTIFRRMAGEGAMAATPDASLPDAVVSDAPPMANVQSPPAGNIVAAAMPGEQGNANDVGSADEAVPLQMQPLSSAPKKRALFMRVLLFFLLLALSLALTPPTTDVEEYPAVVKRYLAEAGISGLEVTARAQGVEVRGTVPNDAAMVQLYAMARALHFPVYLEVGVREDVLRAVRSSLGIRGFYPEVNFLEQEGKLRLRVAAYMKDKTLEAGAFAALTNEVKGLPPLERHIVHEKVLAPAFQEALQAAGFTSIRVLYLPGRVDFTGTVRPEDEPRLQRIREDMAARFGAPLFGASQAGETRPLQAAKSGTALRLPEAASDVPTVAAAQKDSEADDPLGGIRVTGVTMSPMRFVTTADGRRLFEGAVLPGGYILEGINTKTLTLRRDGQVFTHTLRGSR